MGEKTSDLDTLVTSAATYIIEVGDPGVKGYKTTVLFHEQGGLEADISAYSGFPLILSGTTFEIIVGTGLEIVSGNLVLDHGLTILSTATVLAKETVNFVTNASNQQLPDVASKSTVTVTNIHSAAITVERNTTPGTDTITLQNGTTGETTYSIAPGETVKFWSDSAITAGVWYVEGPGDLSAKVTAAAVITANALVLGDDGARGVKQATGVTSPNGYDLYIYEPVNDGNPQFRLGASATEYVGIQAVFNSGLQTMSRVQIAPVTASGDVDIRLVPANSGTVQFGSNSARINFVLSSLTGSRNITWPDVALDLTPGTGSFASSTPDIDIHASGSPTLVSGSVNFFDGAVTPTLPVINSGTHKILVTNAHSAAISVARGGTNTITGRDGTTGGTSESIPADSTRAFFANGGTVWRVA